MTKKIQSSGDWRWPAMWLFLALAIFFGTVSTFALISNSKESKRRYDVLMAADAAGGDVQKELDNLRSYIYAHMNTTIGAPNGIKPPIQLKGTYDRLVAAERSKSEISNKQIYAEAQAYCEARFPQGTLQSGRVPCVTEFISARGVKENNIPQGLYQFDFVSPIWSPDLAGWSLVLTAISLVSFFALYWWHRHIKHQISSAS